MFYVWTGTSSLFQIDGISFPINLDLGLTLTTNISVDLLGGATAGASGDVGFTHTTYVSLFNGVTGSTSHTLDITPVAPSVNIHGTVDAQVGLLPNISFSLLGILSASAGLEVYAEEQLAVSIPPFPALNNAYSSCDEQHYLEYSAWWGVRNNRLTAGVAININIDPLGVELYDFIFDRYWEDDDFDSLTQRTALVSQECLLDVPASSDTALGGVVWTLQLVGSFDFTQPQAMISLVLDVSTALQQPVGRFALSSSAVSPGSTRRRLLQQMSPGTTTVLIAMLPSWDPTQSSPAQLLQQAQAQEADPHSALYSGRTTRNAVVLVSSSSSSSSSGSWDESSTGVPPSLGQGGSSSASSSPSTILLIAIVASVGGALLLVAAVVGMYCCLTRAHKSHQVTPRTSVVMTTIGSNEVTK